MSKRKIITLPTGLQALMDRHRNQCEEWMEGRPVELFRQDGLPCVRYESGAWWHYDIAAGTWF